jgi:phosphoglycolate phosphatase
LSARRLAIFDLDGTLVDSVDDLAASVNYALARAGLPQRDRDEVRRFIGNGARPLIERAVAPHLERVEEVLADWRTHYDAHLLDHTRPYPGIVEQLARTRLTLAVQSNKPAPMTRRILEGLGLLSRFAVVVGGGDVPAKPDPAGVLSILAQVGASREQAVFIGDSATDVATARNAGVTFVAVSWGLVSREELVRGGAVNLVDRAEELGRWLA